MNTNKQIGFIFLKTSFCENDIINKDNFNIHLLNHGIKLPEQKVSDIYDEYKRKWNETLGIDIVDDEFDDVVEFDMVL